MSALAQQLTKIKHQQRATSVAPNAPQPTLLLDKHTATTTSHDIFYTMAVIAYAKLIKEDPTLKAEGDVLMGTQYREVVRNTLGKEQNRKLSEKLVRFMVRVAPYFMVEDCQRVIEYLLHNFKVNIFEAEPLAIIFLQFWNTKEYLKLIGNIPEKVLAVKLPFLPKIKSEQVVNITFIVKSMAYSHFLMASLLLYTLEYVRGEGKMHENHMDIEINLGEEYKPEARRQLLRADPRRFLLQIFSEFFNRKMTACYKYILQFCGKALSASSGTRPSTETCSMVMLLSTRMLIQDSLSIQLLRSYLGKLVKVSQRDEDTKKGLFDFVMIAWQRKPAALTAEVVEFLQNSEDFGAYLRKFRCSLFMVLIDLLTRWRQGHFYPKIVSLVCSKTKEDDFYRNYKQQYLSKLFDQIEQISELGKCNDSLTEALRDNFLYEFCCHFNGKIVASSVKDMIKKVKNGVKVGKGGEIVINMKEISKPVQNKKKKEVAEEPVYSESEQEQEKVVEQKPAKPKSPLVLLLQKRGLKVKKINEKDASTQEALLTLVRQFYEDKQKSPLSQQQKNQILSYLIDSYNSTYLAADLASGDYILPTKYLASKTDLTAAKIVLDQLLTSTKLVSDVLFRQLMRLSLVQLASSMNSDYKGVVYYLNTLFKKMMGKYASEVSELVPLSEILLKVSQETFGKVGTKKGKYQKIMHNHGKLIAELVIALKSKRSVTKNLAQDERTVLGHYIRLIGTFGVEQLYLLNIGIVESLTRKELDHGHIRYFIGKIILGSLRQGSCDLFGLTLSMAKTLIFCSSLNSSILTVSKEELDSSITSGIAKSTIVEFFGLVKDKFKRVVIKKMMLFIRGIFNNTHFVEHFKLTLVELLPHELERLMGLFTQLYYILTSVKSEDKQVQQFKDNILTQITNLFPLSLQLDLFEPLLPNQHLYTYLSQQLQDHSPQKTLYSKLGTLINVVPDEVSFEWVSFARECLLRGNKPSEQTVAALMAMVDLDNRVTEFAQLVCEFVEHCPNKIYEHLPLCIEIVEKHCEEPTDYTLALVAKLVRNLGQMVDPYLPSLLLASLKTQSQLTEQFILEVVEHLAPSTLIRLTKQTHKKADNLSNFTLWLKAVVGRGVGDALTKTVLIFFNRSLLELLSLQDSPRQLVSLQGDVLVAMGLKMNEHQLRKMIIELVRWSESKSQMQDGLPFNYRKIVVAQCYLSMASNLGPLFTPFYGYIYESFIRDMAAIGTAIDSRTKVSKDIKRQREGNHAYREELTIIYVELVLKALQRLFKNDSDHQFLDSVKIQALADPLVELLGMSQIERYLSLVGCVLVPCLVDFHCCIADDYQMKTVNYKVLVMLKRKSPKLQRHVYELFEGLVQAMQDRFLMLVGDLVPFLLEAVSSRQEGIATVARRIIAKVEDISGVEIGSYAQ